MQENAWGREAALDVRTVWISDLHLGTPGCQALALLDFLRSVECETLYLVGDIVDGWQLKRSWYWPQAHNDVVQKILRKARKGTRVVFVPGNHDEFARRYAAQDFGGIEVALDCVHRLADGRRLWVTHGDRFDGVVQCAKWLAHAGDAAYGVTLAINRGFNQVRARLGLPYWSLSRYLKFKVKRAVSYVGDFEAAVAREARQRGMHGVVCGHIHHAEMRAIDGILYCNDGDWVESLTALVEHHDGRLEIVDRSAHGARAGRTARGARAREPAAASRADAQARRGAARRADTLRPEAMRIALVTDAWLPQVNGVVTTLVELRLRLLDRGHAVRLVEPSSFRRFACPGYREIELAWRPYAQVAAALEAGGADAIHIATEGPLGQAARRWCLRHGRRFTTAFHTRFPDVLAQALGLPSAWGYALFRRFHGPSAGVMVPTEGMRSILQAHRFAALKSWSHGVDLELFRPVPAADFGLPRPVFLYVGRVSYEKNLEAFLGLDLPGTKLVYGTGPLLGRLRAAHPGVVWRGVVPRAELPFIYSASDVFVFPSLSETFGLVMLEAMACGTPVAAYPVAGPLDVVGDSRGGVLHADLRRAALAALDLPRSGPLARARQFGWDSVTEQFVGHLVPAV